MATMQKITPFLWFDRQAEEAVNYYLSIFKNSGIDKVTRYGKEGFEVHGMPEGTALTVEFRLEGQRFLALNGGPAYRFNEAVSFVVHCKDQEEVDYYWGKLTEGGDEKAQVCGWLKDRYGLSWQVVPDALPRLLGDKDPVRAGRVMQAMMKMKKIEVGELTRAYEGA